MKKLISFALIFVILLSFSSCKKPHECRDAEYTPLATAVYPTDAKYPLEANYSDKNGEIDYYAYSQAESLWFNAHREKNTLEVYDDGIADYVKNTLSVLAKKDNQNLVYSPANIYFALAMLAECTGGSTQSEILNVLGYDNTETLRKNTSNLWQKMYADYGVYSSVLANSIWLADGIDYNKDTLDTLKNSYFASAYSGNFSNESYSAAVRDWINKNTKDLLKNQSKDIKFNKETVAALVSTVYFNAKWNDRFNKDLTEKGDFFGTGGKVKADFMKSSHSQTYYYANGYSATTLNFDVDGSMHFILPDKDSSVYDIITNDGVLDIITNRAASYEYEGEVKKAYPIVNLSVPKFDVATDIDLKDAFNTLGINTVFDENRADFSSLTTDVPLFLSKVKHASRVKIDEDGCEAAAYTVMIKEAGAAPPDNVVDMVLNRPFIFAISGKDGMPRFVGIISQP